MSHNRRSRAVGGREFLHLGPWASDAAHAGPVSNPAFAELVARQAGVVALAQVVATGVPARTVQRRAQTWRRLHPGVYLVAGHRLTDEARIRAALLWAGPDAVVSGQAAAAWHGFPVVTPSVVEVTVPGRRKPRRTTGVRVRRRDLHEEDVTAVRGVRVAAPPLAALEAAIALANGSVFLDRVLQRHVPFPELYGCYCRNLGWAGSAAAGKLITAAADRADSAAERIVTKMLRRAGITGWSVGVPFGPYTLDVAFVEAKLAIEVDGWAWHADADRFRADRRKGNALVRAGWTVLRFTWHDLTRRQGACVAEVRATLARLAA